MERVQKLVRFSWNESVQSDRISTSCTGYSNVSMYRETSKLKVIVVRERKEEPEGKERRAQLILSGVWRS